MAILPITLGILPIILELGRRHWALGGLGGGLMMMAFAATGTLVTAYPGSSKMSGMVRAVTQAVAAETPPGTQVQLDAELPNLTLWRAGNDIGRIPIFVSGILLDLDHFGIPSCFRNPTFDFFVSPERICPRTSSTRIRAYRLTFASCPPGPPQRPERVGEGIAFGVSSWWAEGRCIALIPVT